MSTPLPVGAAVEVQKKKNKGSTDDSVKKRKREGDAEEQQDEQTINAPAAKKPKKQKAKGVDDGAAEPEGRVAVTVTPVAEPPSKKSKKAKHMETDRMEEAVPDMTEKRKKKKKKSSPQEAPNGTIGPSTTDTPAKQRKSKKDGKPSPDAARPIHTPVKSVGSQQNGASSNILDKHSPFIQKTTSFYLALSPCAHDFPLEGLCAEHISPLLLSYYPPLKGVVLSYSDPRLSEHPDDKQRPQAGSSREAKTVLARSIDEYAVTYVWLSAEFVVFKPEKGRWMEGFVNLQNESLLGLVCFNYFNAAIDRSRLPRDWQWISAEIAEVGKGKKALKEGEGYWANAEGERVEGRVVFRVRDFEATPGSELGAGSINIQGSLLSEEDERKVIDEERQNAAGGRGR